jgi:hypothetical protein
LMAAGCSRAHRSDADREARGDAGSALTTGDAPRLDPWCYLRFSMAEGSSFRQTAGNPSDDPSCENFLAVVDRLSGRPQAIATITACAHLPTAKLDSSARGAKEDRWLRRTWFGDVLVKPAGNEKWVTEIDIRREGSRVFPASVMFRSSALGRSEMRSFLLAVANGDFHPSDCKTSAVANVCALCDEVRNNRARWNDPKQDLLKLFERKP